MSHSNELAKRPSGEEDDDRPIGRILNRREILALLGGAAGASLLPACQAAGRPARRQHLEKAGNLHFYFHALW